MEAATLDARAQRDEALARANHIRSWRAERKRELKAGRLHVTALLRACPPELCSMRVLDLLLAQPRVGRVTASKLLARHRIGPSRTVGALSDRQRRELLVALAMPAG